MSNRKGKIPHLLLLFSVTESINTSHETQAVPRSVISLSIVPAHSRSIHTYLHAYIHTYIQIHQCSLSRAIGAVIANCSSSSHPLLLTIILQQ